MTLLTEKEKTVRGLAYGELTVGKSKMMLVECPNTWYRGNGLKSENE